MSMQQRIAHRLKTLRANNGWSLDDLATRSGVSRATLSRLENGDVSPTTNVLGKLCTAFGLTLSRLMHLVEDNFTPHIKHADQLEWQNAESNFRRRSISPPAKMLAGEVLECEICPDTTLAYDNPPTSGLEHHLVLTAGVLDVFIEGNLHTLEPGDCLRYQLVGESVFKTPSHSGAKYFLFIV